MWIRGPWPSVENVTPKSALRHKTEEAAPEHFLHGNVWNYLGEEGYAFHKCRHFLFISAYLEGWKQVFLSALYACEIRSDLCIFASSASLAQSEGIHRPCAQWSWRRWTPGNCWGMVPLGYMARWMRRHLDVLKCKGLWRWVILVWESQRYITCYMHLYTV